MRPTRWGEPAAWPLTSASRHAAAAWAALALAGAACTGPATGALPPGKTAGADAPTPGEAPLRVVYAVDVRAADLVDAADVVVDVLDDPRGWVRAGYRFERAAAAPNRIVIAEGDEVDRLCAPYDTRGGYSCQLGRVVALNADRWRTATPEWMGDLATYRQMLVNHEVGHLLGLHHPRPQCPTAGEPAAVMAQQSTELGGCLPNPWPLAWEIDLLRRRSPALAPGYDPDPPRPHNPGAR